MATAGSSAFLITLVTLAGLADVLAVHAHTAVALKTTMGHPVELDGMMQCMMGCFTAVMTCAFGCMIPCVIACPTLPLCITNCDLKTVGCMFRCSTTPSPPKPKPKPNPPASFGLHLDAHKITTTHY
ncbi:hypothetical protein ZWY2020_054260 [Hordeum vulgare]|nr:hypothetical protein ZWY2020_054260 [Hordeum vulgare]